jgi:uncharacterized protein DUF29
MNWQELAATSHYQTAVAVDQALEQGDVPGAKAGIEELIDALSRADRRALKSHLIRLMSHIIKWKSQPSKRSLGWRGTIQHARREIADIQEDTPSLTREVIEAMWQRCFDAAKDDAEGKMNQKANVGSLNWREVFAKGYEVPSKHTN